MVTFTEEVLSFSDVHENFVFCDDKSEDINSDIACSSLSGTNRHSSTDHLDHDAGVLLGPVSREK